MDDFIEALLKLIPFSSWFESLGFSKETSAALSVVVVALLVWASVWAIRKLRKRWINSKAARDLKPQFDYQMVEQATRYFIPTQFQNASPARQDEPGFTHQYVSTSPLIPFFVKTAFNEKVDSERFYLILADSGMGKTTFMINLYIKYHSFFNWRRKHKMRHFRFSHPDTLQKVKDIDGEEAKNTILLLDALDEDRNIVSDNPDTSDTEAFERRVDEIIEATRNFCDVVITCRTQYFPGQEDDPYELKVKRPDEKGFYILNKLYISPFTDKEVKKYLKKKFGWIRFWNRAKKKRAAQLVGQARHLVMRPMMLSYIDYLVEENLNFETDSDIYEMLIEKWLIREAEKRKRISDRNTFIRNLRQVSQQTAIAIYRNWRGENRLYLTREEAVDIAEKNDIDLKPEEVTGQSLLTCDGSGNWKFAHKSILEFFLAREAIEDIRIFSGFGFAGMDMARHFFEEKNPENLVFVKGGSFNMGSSEDGNLREVEVSSFWICKYPVTQEGYVNISGKSNPSKFKDNDNNPVDSVTWWDAVKYCNSLNKKYGLPPTYGDTGDLLDTSGQATTDISKVHGFRLPTEAEWEYAARGGKESIGFEYSGSNNINEVAWNEGNSGGKTHPVGTLKSNELGLYDMSGNVWEWCYDWYGDYPATKEKNPIGPASGSFRVLRGGSWSYDAQFCRSAARSHALPVARLDSRGFRLVFVP